MKILLVSGFLGAGKTTFIKEMAKNINLEFVVLENEYADIGIDGDFLDEKNLNVWEMSEGCICCSMKGDFKSSIKKIYFEINPEYLVIEPTGVGMLSSIIENIREINNNDIEILSPLTLIDITSFNEYLETFNNFFIDNLKNTGKVILTKLENYNPFDIENIKNEISKINNNLEIITDDYRTFPKEWFGEILNKSIDNIFSDLKKESYKLFNLNSNIDSVSKKIADKISLDLTVKSKMLITDLYSEMSKKTLLSKDFEDIERKSKFYETDIKKEILEKYKFKITNKIDYKEANKLYTSLGMAAGTMALGGIFKYVLQNHINIPFIVIICGAIVAFGVTYFSKPSADKRNLEKAVNEFLDKTKKEFIAWFDEIEKYYNKRVKDIINYFEEK